MVLLYVNSTFESGSRCPSLLTVWSMAGPYWHSLEARSYIEFWDPPNPNLLNKNLHFKNIAVWLTCIWKFEKQRSGFCLFLQPCSVFTRHRESGPKVIVDAILHDLHVNGKSSQVPHHRGHVAVAMRDLGVWAHLGMGLGKYWVHGPLGGASGLTRGNSCRWWARKKWILQQWRHRPGKTVGGREALPVLLLQVSPYAA